MSPRIAPMNDLELRAVASRICMQVQAQLESMGSPVEDQWLILGVAARVAERAVLETNRFVSDLKTHVAAEERLKRLLVEVDAECDRVEERMAREDGAPPVVRS